MSRRLTSAFAILDDRVHLYHPVELGVNNTAVSVVEDGDEFKITLYQPDGSLADWMTIDLVQAEALRRFLSRQLRKHTKG